MQPFKANVAFAIPPRAIYLEGQPSPAVYSYEEVVAAKSEGAREASQRVTREFEAKLKALRDGVVVEQDRTLEGLRTQFEQALGQMRALLPQLVVEATARVLAGVRIDAEVVRRVVEDLLSEVAPDAEQVEVQLCDADLKRMEQFEPQLRQKFPSLTFRENAELRPGDALVRTRFGVLDGRIQTKIRGLEALLS